jgi:hypothetical protein
MNKLRISLLLVLFCSLLKAQTDTTRITPGQPNTTTDNPAEPQAAPAQPNTTTGTQPASTPTNTPQQPPPTRKRPKGYNDYVNGKRVGDTKPFTDNLYYGCNIQLGFGSNGYGNIFYYDLSPHVGYKFGDVLSAGIQIIYNNQILTSGAQRYSYNIYGSGVFGRALFLNRFFAQVEYDVLSVPGTYRNNAIVSRYLSDERMAGLGYKSPLGDKLGYFFMILFDFQPTINSPYYGNQLVYRAGLSWNF